MRVVEIVDLTPAGGYERAVPVRRVAEVGGDRVLSIDRNGVPFLDSV